MIPVRKGATQYHLPAWTRALSQARWIEERRVRGYSRVIVAMYVATIIVVVAISPHWIDPGGKPVGTDFMNVWTAGKLALRGRAADAYDYGLHYTVQQNALPWKKGQSVPFYGWHYPPMFMGVAAVLALLPYGAALGVWLLATLPLYGAAVCGILGARKWIVTALAFPAVLVNVSHGQNGFLTAGLLGGALLLLERRPWVAGALFGLLAYKPQFALLIPVALVAGGCWRAIWAAAATASGMAAVSWAVLGPGAWRAFFTSLTVSRTYLLEQGAPGWEKMQSIFSAVRMFGGSIGLAYAAQAVFAAGAASAVLWIWRRRPGSETLKSSALATATLIATPYVLDYDLIVLALPIAWLAAAGAREGFLPWEKISLLAAWLLPLLSRLAGGSLHLPLAPAVMTLVLLLIVRRALAAQRVNSCNPKTRGANV